MGATLPFGPAVVLLRGGLGSMVALAAEETLVDGRPCAASVLSVRFGMS